MMGKDRVVGVQGVRWDRPCARPSHRPSAKRHGTAVASQCAPSTSARSYHPAPPRCRSPGVRSQLCSTVLAASRLLQRGQADLQWRPSSSHPLCDSECHARQSHAARSPCRLGSGPRHGPHATAHRICTYVCVPPAPSASARCVPRRGPRSLQCHLSTLLQSGALLQCLRRRAPRDAPPRRASRRHPLRVDADPA